MFRGVTGNYNEGNREDTLMLAKTKGMVRGHFIMGIQSPYVHTCTNKTNNLF